MFWKPSDEPHKIYGKTLIPTPSKNVKNVLLAGVGIGFGYMILKSKFSGKEK